MRKIVILGKKGIPRIFGKKIVSSKVHNQFLLYFFLLYITAKRLLFKNMYLDFEISYWK